MDSSFYEYQEMYSTPAESAEVESAEPIEQEVVEETDNFDYEQDEYTGLETPEEESSEEEAETSEGDEVPNEETADDEDSDGIADSELKVSDFFKLEIPEKFTTKKEENEWYKNAFLTMNSQLDSEEFLANISQRYDDHLKQVEANNENRKAIINALEGRPELFAKIYLPQLLKDNNIDPTVSEDELAELVDIKMKEAFGDNYSDYYNQGDLLNPNTISSRMLAYNQQLVKQIQEQSKANEQLQATPQLQPQQEIDPAVFQAELDKQRKEYFADFTDEEFNEFINDMRDWHYDLRDLHNARYFDDYIKQAKEQAYEEGKKNAYKEISKQGGIKIKPTVVKEETVEEDDYFSPHRRIAMGGLY